MDLTKLNNEFFLPEHTFFTQTLGYIDTLYHSHTFFEVFYVISGEALHNVNGSVEKIGMGDIIFLRPGDSHAFSFYNSENFLHTDILFNTEYFNKVNDFLCSPYINHYLADKKHLKIRISSDQISYFETSIKNINSIIDQNEQNSLILSFLSSLFSLVCFHYAHKKNSNYPLWLEQLISILNINSSLRKSKSEILSLLDNFNYNPSYLSRAFSKHIGITITDYLNNLRFSTAYSLITSTDMTIEKVIDYVGLSSKAYFYQEFKKRYHITPNKLRKNSNSPQDI